MKTCAYCGKEIVGASREFDNLHFHINDVCYDNYYFQYTQDSLIIAESEEIQQEIAEAEQEQCKRDLEGKR